jgi:hypothetical protein
VYLFQLVQASSEVADGVNINAGLILLVLLVIVGAVFLLRRRGGS